MVWPKWRLLPSCLSTRGSEGLGLGEGTVHCWGQVSPALIWSSLVFKPCPISAWTSICSILPAPLRVSPWTGNPGPTGQQVSGRQAQGGDTRKLTVRRGEAPRDQNGQLEPKNQKVKWKLSERLGRWVRGMQLLTRAGGRVESGCDCFDNRSRGLKSCSLLFTSTGYHRSSVQETLGWRQHDGLSTRSSDQCSESSL